MTAPTGYLFKMLLFLAAVATIAVFRHEHLENAFLANPGLNAVICVVMLVGAVHALYQTFMLNGDVQWVEAFRRRRSGAVPLPQPRLLVAVAGAFGNREKQVRLSAASMRALLDGIASRLDETREILKYLIGLQIFLGLLGTFWGLIATVTSISGILNTLQITGDTAHVFQNLKDGLTAPLSGMGTSFSSSMFGLAGALITGFMDLQAGQAQRRFFNELEEWMTSVTRHSASTVGGDGEMTVPAYIQALLEQTAESIDSLQRIVSRTEEGRASANRSLEMLTDRLSVLTEQMRAEQSLLVRLAEQHIETQPLLKRLTESATGGAFDEGTKSSVQRMDMNLGRLLQELETGRKEVLQDLRSEIKLLARTISRVQDEQRS